MAIARKDKYADYVYEIKSDAELREAKWLIAQGDFTDMNDYLDCARRAEVRIMKREDAKKKKLAAARQQKRIELKQKRKAA